MRVMKAITENQRAALEFIGRDPSRYFKAGDIDGLDARVAGMCLKGLYKRGLVDRVRRPKCRAALYQINRAGQLELMEPTSG